MIHLVALLSGIVFGLGLILSGMANPAIVLSFLDITGEWNASLLWVMGGAIFVGTIAFAIAKKHKLSYLGAAIDIPVTTQIEGRLIGGSLIFGIGWGIAGICPGPAMVLVGTGNLQAFIFLTTMLVGMSIFEFVISRR